MKYGNRRPRNGVTVPLEQMEAAVQTASENTAAFTAQMYMEQMILTLHDEFGFGQARCTKAMEAFEKRIAEWNKNVMGEFDAETFRMRYKRRQAHRAELEWTWERHDAALQPLVEPEKWKPYKERFGSFGGTGVWCE